MNVRAVAVTLALAVLGSAAGAQAPDPRLREVVYDAQAVVTVPVRRGSSW